MDRLSYPHSLSVNLISAALVPIYNLRTFCKAISYRRCRRRHVIIERHSVLRLQSVHGAP